MVYIETPANPTLHLTDIEETVRLARKYSGPKLLLLLTILLWALFFKGPLTLGQI